MQNIANAWAPTGPNWVALGNCIGQGQGFFALALGHTLFSPGMWHYLTAACKHRKKRERSISHDR